MGVAKPRLADTAVGRYERRKMALSLLPPKHSGGPPRPLESIIEENWKQLEKLSLTLMYSLMK
ncbi:MAG: hypothetical protein Q8O86_07365 [Dehalococcoidia bacterium]|nr:hypothetical protein [Dehalococcoidia bacterium]